MNNYTTSLLILTGLLIAAPLEAGITVDPTLLSSTGSTLVTATATGGARFYIGTTPPHVRIYLTQKGNRLDWISPTSLSQTKVTVLFPKLKPGFFGFVISVFNSMTLRWVDFYSSSDQYFQVAADTDPTRVFNTFAEPLTPELYEHPVRFITTTQVVVSGVISGSVPMSQYISGGFTRQHLKDFRWDGEGNAGIIFAMDFNLDGDTKFHYSIPFTMTIEVPKTVYAGQTFWFTPRSQSFRYLGTDTLTADHSYDYSTDHRLMVNVPYDTLPPLDITLSQQPTHLEVSGSVPSGVPWVDVDFGPIDIGGPFDDGGHTFDGVTFKLGGHTDFNTSFDSIKSFPDGTRQVWTGETRTSDVWFVAGDQIKLLAEIPIPVVQYAAIILAGARVELNNDWNLNVKSTDFIHLNPPYLFDFGVNVPGSALGTWPVHKTFTFFIDGSLVSDFVYEMATDITFDMPFIDEITIASWELSDIHSQRSQQENTFSGTFTLDTQVEVLPRTNWLAMYATPGLPRDVMLANYTPSQASAESNRIACLVFTPPTLPPVISTTNQGTFPTKLESEFALMLSTNPPAAGTISANPLPVDGGYAAGTVVTLTATAKNGYRFTGWSGDVTGSANPTIVTLNGVSNLMANFSATVIPLAFGGTNSILSVSNGLFNVHLTGPPGTSVVVESSPNMRIWTPLRTNTLSAGGLDLTIPVGTNKQQFFRARIP